MARAVIVVRKKQMPHYSSNCWAESGTGIHCHLSALHFIRPAFLSCTALHLCALRLVPLQRAATAVSAGAREAVLMCDKDSLETVSVLRSWRAGHHNQQFFGIDQRAWLDHLVDLCIAVWIYDGICQGMACLRELLCSRSSPVHDLAMQKQEKAVNTAKVVIVGDCWAESGTGLNCIPLPSLSTALHQTSISQLHCTAPVCLASCAFADSCYCCISGSEGGSAHVRQRPTGVSRRASSWRAGHHNQQFFGIDQRAWLDHLVDFCIAVWIYDGICQGMACLPELLCSCSSAVHDLVGRDYYLHKVGERVTSWS